MIIVDRIEGKFAVCGTENGMIDIPIKFIKGKVRDGDVVVEKDGIYSVDEEATKRRSLEMKASVSSFLTGESMHHQ
ncbi:MAG: DUF3006 domain-containing protein [Spirochaetia bacterium]|jgi:hypothetical protein